MNACPGPSSSGVVDPPAAAISAPCPALPAPPIYRIRYSALSPRENCPAANSLPSARASDRAFNMGTGNSSVPSTMPPRPVVAGTRHLCGPFLTHNTAERFRWSPVQSIRLRHGRRCCHHPFGRFKLYRCSHKHQTGVS